MHLRDYLDKEEITLAEFGRRCGISDVAVGRYVRGERWPKPKVMRQIVAATGGKVKPNDFLIKEPAE